MGLSQYSQTYKPLKYQFAEDYRKKSENMHWIAEEADLTKDVEDFKRASKEEREFIKNILSIFTQSDFNVAKGYLPLINQIKNNEVRGMLTSFMAREFIHQEGYAHLNESLGFPDNYYTDFLQHKETLEKNTYMQDDIFKDNFGLSLAKGILLEGISLFGSFIMLKNFEREGKYLGMCQINDWSLKDETLHVEGNAMLFKVWCRENKGEINDTFKRHIYSTAREIVELEKAFIDFAYGSYEPYKLNKDEVKRYIEFIADRRLVQLGLKANYGINTNPLPFMDEVNNGSSLQNFFEGRVTEYSVVGMTGDFKYE